VPDYGQTRTFALERVQTLAVRDDHFEPRALPPEPFANSLGVFSGSPELVEIAFDARCADYVREREWHRSQEIVDGADGALMLRLTVSDDLALRAWILSFGASAKVMAPAQLAREIYAEVQAAADRYGPSFDSLLPSTRVARSGQGSRKPGTFEMLRVMPSMSEGRTMLRSEPVGDEQTPKAPAPSELELLRAEVRAGFAEMRAGFAAATSATDVAAEFKVLRAEMAAGFKTVRAEIAADGEKSRRHMDAFADRVESHVKHLKRADGVLRKQRGSSA